MFQSPSRTFKIVFNSLFLIEQTLSNGNGFDCLGLPIVHLDSFYHPSCYSWVIFHSISIKFILAKINKMYYICLNCRLIFGNEYAREIVLSIISISFFLISKIFAFLFTNILTFTIVWKNFKFDLYLNVRNI